ncbi:MAG UNVERIFIED_CONTAM: hypothetical protein LVQ98_05225 [Rickettsiaceae bacterium]|jgi:hypothetical protein
MEHSDNYLFEELSTLEHEYADLESIVFEELFLDPVTIKRIKKRKIWVRDRIEAIRSALYPAVIA